MTFRLERNSYAPAGPTAAGVVVGDVASLQTVCNAAPGLAEKPAGSAACLPAGCVFVWRLLTNLDDAFEGKLTKRPYTEGADIAAKHTQQLPGSGSAVSSAMPQE
ncbi:TPA: hypothetical protein ACH3X1_003704 [Trebouxia sp. C0004]